jgi:hypothetical protein
VAAQRIVHNLLSDYGADERKEGMLCQQRHYDHRDHRSKSRGKDKANAWISENQLVPNDNLAGGRALIPPTIILYILLLIMIYLYFLGS